MLKNVRRETGVLLVVMFALALVFMGMSAYSTTSAHETSTPSVVSLPGYHVSVFARGTSAYSHPDSVVSDGKFIYVGYQNVTAKDGSDHKSSTIVKYDKDGKVVKTFSFLGHNDGLRLDPRTHLLWATSNEDANPNLGTIDPNTGKVAYYTLPKTPHGGGYDDLAFVNGKAFLVASNPTLNAAGVNVFPALVEVTLSAKNAILKTVLVGNAKATDTITNTTVTLNEVDPDSLSINPQGDLVLVNQAGSELVTIHKAGTSSQTVTRTPVGTQVDDTVWATSKEGHLLVVDGANNVIYTVSSDFKSGTIYTEAPSDSGVAGFVGTLAPKTGIITPIIIGLGSPTGLLFLADK